MDPTDPSHAILEASLKLAFVLNDLSWAENLLSQGVDPNSARHHALSNPDPTPCVAFLMRHGAVFDGTLYLRADGMMVGMPAPWADPDEEKSLASEAAIRTLLSIGAEPTARALALAAASPMDDGLFAQMVDAAPAAKGSREVLAAACERWNASKADLLLSKGWDGAASWKNRSMLEWCFMRSAGSDHEPIVLLMMGHASALISRPWGARSDDMSGPPEPATPRGLALSLIERGLDGAARVAAAAWKSPEATPEERAARAQLLASSLPLLDLSEQDALTDSVPAAPSKPSSRRRGL